ncbi:MAG TPA: hypothetical protein VGN97_02955 [Mesorhizobium sp.]|nr:hypothetical protein [Mesorhizobium sp.]
MIKMAFGRHYHLGWKILAAVVRITGGIGLLGSGWQFIALALMLDGCGSGIFSIARGTLPLALFGAGRYATLMGELALPSLMVQALAATAGAYIFSRWLSSTTFGV